MSVLFGGPKLMLGVEPARRVGSRAGTPAPLFVLSDGRQRSRAGAVPGLIWWSRVHFHCFLCLFGWTQLHGLHGIWQQEQPVLSRDCPRGLPGTRSVLGPGCRAGGSSGSVPRTHAAVRFISVQGYHAAVFFTATAGSRAVIRTTGTALLPTAVCVAPLLSLHATVVTPGRPRPPVTVQLTGWPVPRVLAVPMVPLIVSIHGLHA